MQPKPTHLAHLDGGCQESDPQGWRQQQSRSPQESTKNASRENANQRRIDNTAATISSECEQQKSLQKCRLIMKRQIRKDQAVPQKVTSGNLSLASSRLLPLPSSCQ